VISSERLLSFALATFVLIVIWPFRSGRDLPSARPGAW
jgi:hypothetical protein